MEYKIELYTLAVVLLMVMSSSIADVHTTFLGVTDKKDIVSSTSLGMDDAYDFVILTPSEFAEELQPLVPHKESHGIKTKIITLSEIYNGEYFSVMGRDEPEKIKYFIKNATENWGIEYVLLVGNKEKMPVRYSNPYFTLLSKFNNRSDPFITDLYYADIFYNGTDNFCSWDSNNNHIFGELTKTDLIDDVDLYPDIYIGRILCSTSEDVDNIVKKIIVYENTANKQSWFNNLVVCGGNSGWQDNILQFLGLLYPDKVAWEGEYLGDRIIENASDFNIKKLYASAIFPSGDQTADVLTMDNFFDVINDGAGFVVFSGHGNDETFTTYFPYFNFWPLPFVCAPFPSGFDSDDVQNLDNEDRHHILILDACSCADFSENGAPSPIAWEFVNLEKGGAVASYACTRDSWNAVGTGIPRVEGGYIVTHMFKAYSEGKNRSMDRTGIILAKAITDYLDTFDDKDVSFIHNICCLEYWILFGDPTLKIGGYPL